LHLSRREGGCGAPTNTRRRGQPGYGLRHSTRDSRGSKTAGKASRTWFDKMLRSACAEREPEPKRTGPCRGRSATASRLGRWVLQSRDH
jgi:hypothetical protein